MLELTVDFCFLLQNDGYFFGDYTYENVNRNRIFMYHSVLYAYIIFSLIFYLSVKCCMLIYSIMENEVIKEFQLFWIELRYAEWVNLNEADVCSRSWWQLSDCFILFRVGLFTQAYKLINIVNTHVNVMNFSGLFWLSFLQYILRIAIPCISLVFFLCWCCR